MKRKATTTNVALILWTMYSPERIYTMAGRGNGKKKTGKKKKKMAKVTKNVKKS